MKIKFLITLTLLVVSVSSCDACEEKELGRCDLTEPQKQLIPYEKGQVYSFIDSRGLSIDLTVIRSEQTWLREDIDGGNMCTDYIMFRNKGVILKSEPNNIEISLGISAGGCFSENAVGRLGIDIGIYNNRRCGYNLYSDAEGNFLTDNSFYVTEIHKSVEINGNVYFDVVEQKYTLADEGISKPYRIFLQLFYNKTYGILQINRDGENFLTIKPKENNSPDGIDCIDIPLADSAGAE